MTLSRKTRLVRLKRVDDCRNQLMVFGSRLAMMSTKSCASVTCQN